MKSTELYPDGLSYRGSVRYPSRIHEREECRLNFKILSNMSHVFGTSSNRIAISVLVTCSGLWAGCGTTLVPQSDRDSESQAVFHQLAGLEVASNRLYESIADQSDVEGFSHQLEVESDRGSPFTSFERAHIAHSFKRSLKVMLFDLAPANFWEHHLAQYHTSTLSITEARQLVESYGDEILIPTSRVHELRRSFVMDRLPALLPAVRARSLLFHISNEAMVPTLLPGDHVIADRAAYHTAEPRRGDVVVYRYPGENGTRFVHRVIGVPGDRIDIRNQVVSVNEEVVTEPSVQHSDRSSMAGNVRDNFGPMIVPPDTYFVLGDNREESLDSRFLGPISKEHILGQAVFIYWSIDHSTGIPRWDRLNRSVH
jgi:signal peptidase I